jgi:hypothetical protein
MKKIFVSLVMLGFLISGCKAELKTPTPVEPVATTALVSTDVPPIPGDLGWGKIHGKIIAAVTGEPISGATVTCQHSSYTSHVTCSGSVTTNADGIYFFGDAFFHDTDTFRLTIQATGYQTQEITLAASSFVMPYVEVNISLTSTP